MQLAQKVYYGREYGGKKERQKNTKEQMEALVMAVRTVLKQPEKNAKGDPGENGWVCYYCVKEGHTFCPLLMSVSEVSIFYTVIKLYYTKALSNQASSLALD